MLNEAFIKYSLQSDGVPGFLEDLAAKPVAEALRTKQWSAGTPSPNAQQLNSKKIGSMRSGPVLSIS